MVEQSPLDSKPLKATRPPVLARIRGYFLAGILVTAPITITIWFAWQLIEFIDEAVVPLIPRHLNPDTYLREALGFNIGLPGLGVIVLFVAITLIGAATAGFVGRWVVSLWERGLNRMPLIRGIYRVVKQLIETILTDQSQAFRKAILLEYPRKGLWSLGFVSADPADQRLAKLTGEDLIAVFVPTTPNPTSGFLLFVPRADAHPLDMPVEEAFKLLISIGIVSEQSQKSGQKSDKKNGNVMGDKGNLSLSAPPEPEKS